jgi:hypothetical protein
VQFLVIRLLTNGKIAALVGARTEGNFSTVLEPSSNVFFNEVAKQPRTFGLILLKFHYIRNIILVQFSIKIL